MQNRDIGRQVLIDRPQAVNNPGTNRGTSGLHNPRIEVPDRLLVIGMRGHHGTDHGDLIRMLSRLRQQLRKIPCRIFRDAKTERATHPRAGLLHVHRIHITLRRASVHAVDKLGLGIKEIYMTRPAILKQQDDALGLGAK